MSRKKNDEQELDLYADEKRKFLEQRLATALAAKCKLCKCGGLLYDLDGDGNYVCGDCDKPEEYKP